MTPSKWKILTYRPARMVAAAALLVHTFVKVLLTPFSCTPGHVGWARGVNKDARRWAKRCQMKGSSGSGMSKVKSPGSITGMPRCFHRVAARSSQTVLWPIASAMHAYNDLPGSSKRDYRLSHQTTTKIHSTSNRKPMNQHQFPPCRLAILFIRLNVPPRNVDVEAKASFCESATRTACIVSNPRALGGHSWATARDPDTHHASQLEIAVPHLVSYPRRNLSINTPPCGYPPGIRPRS